MLTPRLPVRTCSLWESLWRLPYYCSRRDAANDMPLKALVLIFVSLPLSPFLVLGASFLLLLVLFVVCCSLLGKSFYCVCCHFLGFRKDVVRQMVIRPQGVTGVTANLKWILKCFLGMFLFTMPLCASYCSMQRKGTPLRRTSSMSTWCADG